MAFMGGCLCGQCRYRIDRRFLNAMHCYCSMCRKAHGTAYSTHAMTRPDQFHWLPGSPALIAYESSEGAFREFCPTCGTHLKVHGQTPEDLLAIPAGTLDGDPPLTLIGHMFTADCVSWHVIQDDLPRHEVEGAV